MDPVILDTDILSYYFKKNPIVLKHFRDYINEHHFVYLTRITEYEILSGLKAKNASKQLSDFRTFSKKQRILNVTSESIELSSEIYAHLYKTGKHAGKADILIAGIALANGFSISTNNTKDYIHIPNLKLINWAID